MVIEEFVDTELLSKNMKHGKDGDMKVEFSTVSKRKKMGRLQFEEIFFFILLKSPPRVLDI